MTDLRSPTTALAFDEDFRQGLAREKYGRWATDLTKDQLLAVLWAVGEYGFRSHLILECLDKHRSEFHPRGYIGLELLADMAMGQRIGVEQLLERFVATFFGRPNASEPTVERQPPNAPVLKS